MKSSLSAAGILAAQLFVSSAVIGAEDCGSPGSITVKTRDGKNTVQTATRVFADGSIAVRARLAVNPDGGPASYTVGDHGFTYLQNGMARWNGKAREDCKADCVADFMTAAKADFGPGTPMFCVFGIEVEAYRSGQDVTSCTKGKVAGKGLGRPKLGALLETVTGDKVQAYLSTTSLQHLVDGKPRYLNSESLPIAVAPSTELLGKIVWIGGQGYKPTWALIGDTGPAFGEGSIALHQLLRYGSISAQKPGPLPAAKRCGPEESNLKAPFLSRPDGKADTCKQGRTVSTASDIRAYGGIVDMLDFVILGKGRLQQEGGVIRSEVTQEALKAAASDYSEQRIQHMLSCLAK